eukprot:gene15373-20724_t
MNENNKKSVLYCTLLAFQFGLQPMISNRFIARGVSKSSVVIATELGKIIIAIVTIFIENQTSKTKTDVFKHWSISDSLKVAALPATLYAIQNLCVQYGYVLLDSMTFNLLNQTKTLSAAFWLWILMNKKQSFVQMIALFLLLAAAVVLNLGPSSSTSVKTMTNVISGISNYHLGLIMVAIASMISGFAAALTQRALVDNSKKRHPYFFSAELAVYGIIFLLINNHFNSDIAEGGNILSNWNLLTFIPVITNAWGGLIVGLVTKYAGGVVKGFALIAGIIITGLAQYIVEGKPLGMKDLVGIILVSLAIYLHSSYPYYVEKERKNV